MTAKAICNGKSFYITSNFGTPTNFWSYDQLTLWESNFKYETIFFGYGSISYQIVCDEEKNGANIIIPYLEALDYSYGETHRHYLHTSARLGNESFFISEEQVLIKDCDKDEKPWDCDTYIYMLYKCDLDYKSCISLPIQFSNSNYIFGYLDANEATNEISFYDNDLNDHVLIFKWGKHPICYVEGCEILGETK